MIIKNEIFELEISEETGVYFGSKTSGQHFKKWEDFKEEERQQIKLIQHTVESLLKSSEKAFLTNARDRNKENGLRKKMRKVKDKGKKIKVK